MADFDRKMQKVFENYIAMIEEGDKEADFYKTAKDLESMLSEEGASVKPPQFFAAVFEELEDPNSRWEVEPEDLKTLYDYVPDTWKRKKFTEEVLTRKVPESMWSDFGIKKMAANLKKKQALAKYANSLKFDGSSVALTHETKDSVVVSVYLGDISECLECLADLDDNSISEHIEDLFGPENVKSLIKKKLLHCHTRFLDWPTVSTLTNATYEIEFTNAAKKIGHAIIGKRVKAVIDSLIS